MNFSEFEKLMNSKGINTLADIARALNSTPQAVSNWKARNQVPYHIIAKVNNSHDDLKEKQELIINNSTISNQNQNFALADILLTIAEQLKVITLVTFISVFFTFTYVRFVQEPKYASFATVLLPDNKVNNMGGLAGIASQFGVNVPSGNNAADLSSPSMIPELLNSRRFAEKIITKKFYTDKLNKSLPLIDILMLNNSLSGYGKEDIIEESVSKFQSMIALDKDPMNLIYKIRITSFEPGLSKNLADSVLSELEELNKFFKIQLTNEKIDFIENRIKSVDDDLVDSELKLKKFNEQNRQISSPALQLELDRLTREVELQKNIYLTLKQQLELAKIDQVQKASIIQILDKPHISKSPINRKLLLSIILATSFGAFTGILLGFARSFNKYADKDDRKKLRKMKNFFNKKIKDLFMDTRVSGTISFVMLVGSPFYFTSKSINPIYFGMYSKKLLIFNLAYLTILVLFTSFYIYVKKDKSKKKESI
tara:strand:- start:4438 stop:5886 length:1449 start_codon:yes stop_codon:yes gene_type:complete